ncbi:polymorphic PE/PPE s C terminal family protein [Mycobacterium kansasii]|uniref:Polymorphic PE/PPE s C terminal family protein n=1 Tax=Mycobacterium kansasii TaxID=1768 RepID=A0A1V3WFF8_MYCKA|nr:polymorphic PE/PPE s C terminal family protein [Mycobacterium kansasii]
MSVPQGWAMSAPAVKPVAAVFAENGLTGAPAAAATQGEGSLFSNMALSGLAGRAMVPTGGTAARSSAQPGALRPARPAVRSTSSSCPPAPNDCRQDRH